ISLKLKGRLGRNCCYRTADCIRAADAAASCALITQGAPLQTCRPSKSPLRRAAFPDHRAAIVALLDEGFDRLREAGELIAEHLRLLRGAVRPSEPTSDPPRAATLTEESTA